MIGLKMLLEDHELLFMQNLYSSNNIKHIGL
jgi:hypothetical protein